eukprot:TRINITY_DN574_c0_g2_i2.p1 TRINITY_DN574_c0_g2~~TRINITY_DN574_c0_g2_i2.p1  ORF type:complete len:4342 (+),score=1501.02 TRINITY_DN574_c0_g2_i2:256-13281(+)
MSRKQHAASLSDVIFKYICRVIDEQKLETTHREDAYGHNWVWKDVDQDACLTLANNLLASLVKDLTGSHEAIYIKHDQEQTQVPLKFQPPFNKRKCMDLLTEGAGAPFPDDDFPIDPNTSALLELMYTTYSERLVQQPTTITHFPQALARQDDTETQRLDVVVMGKRLVSARTISVEGKPRSYFLVCTHDIAAMMASMNDVQLISQALPHEWSNLSDYPMSNVGALLDAVSDSLNVLWQQVKQKRGAMTQKKVIYLMNIVGGDLIGFVRTTIMRELQRKKREMEGTDDMNASQHDLNASRGRRGSLRRQSSMGRSMAEVAAKREEDPSSWEYNQILFESSFPFMRKVTAQAVTLTEKWLKVGEVLSAQFWKDDWQGPPYVDHAVKGFSRRLEDLIRVRATHDQLHQLLAKNELHDMAGNTAWRSFVGIEVLQYSAYTQQEWDRALEQFDGKITPLEQRIALKLRNTFGAVSEQKGALLNEMGRFQDLVKRKGVAEEIVQDREAMLGHFMTQLSQLKEDYNFIHENTALQGHAAVNVFCTQSSQKVESLKISAAALLGQLPKIEKLLATCNDFIDKFAAMQTANYEVFERKFKDTLGPKGALREPLTLCLLGTGLEEGAKPRGRLYVRVSPWLLKLLEEVRQMEAVGVPVGSDARDMAQKLGVFYKLSMHLRRVAAQWNALANQVLKSQRPLLAKHGEKVEEIITKKGDKYTIAIDSVAEVEQLITNLKSNVESVSLENRRLLRLHQSFAEKVVGLLTVDLMANKEKWQATMKDVKVQFESLERTQGYKAMDSWRLHWDVQLYKALEHQYQLGLETLNENLSGFECEMQYKQGMIIFRPSFEQLREQYYGHIKTFLQIPTQFVGVTGQPIFSQMIQRNSAFVAAVYWNAEQLFSQLKRLQRRFKEYTVIGAIWNLDDLLEGVLEDLFDWEKNYVKLEVKRREVEDLHDIIHVDCIRVDLRPLKLAIHEQLNRLLDFLKNSLAASAQKHLDKIGKFINESMGQLTDRPTTIDQIGQATEAVERMTLSRPDMQKEFDVFDAKNAFLRQISKGDCVDATVLRSKWDRFAESVETFKSIMAQQKEKMKNMLGGSIEQFMKQVAKFQSDWEKNKPKQLSHYTSPQQIQEEVIDYCKNKRSEFKQMTEAATEFENQCRYFAMAPPDFGSLSVIDNEMQKAQDDWVYYIEFMDSLDKLTNEEWLVFRSKAFRFEDLLKEWAEKLMSVEPKNEVCDFIQNELIEKWMLFCPLLKFLRGDGFTTDHWAEMFRLTEMEKGVTPEKLRFKHYLDRYRIIQDRADDIRKLHARATGENQVREALQEVRTWAQANDFAMFDKETGDGKRVVPLIKDWKDLLTSVGDNMSLISSLKDSAFFQTFADEILGWEKKFVNLNECLNFLMNIQRKWVYLEPIFAKGALPSEAGRFKRVDTDFVGIMKETKAEVKVIAMGKHQDLPNRLRNVTEQLDRCQKALMDFMEDKRDLFPRFYFIGDDDLLEILGQSTNPKVIQAHLKKLFAGINKVGFDNNEAPKQIVSMLSSAGEVVPMRNSVEIVDFVEIWLGELDVEMKQTLREQSVACYDKYDFVKYPSSMLGLTKLIVFTKECEAAVQAKDVEGLKKRVNEELLGCTAPGAYDQRDRVQDLKMKSLIMDFIHNRDVCQQLIDAKTVNLMEWQWQKQIRFYMETEKDVPWAKIRMVDSCFLYTYEYQGNASKLVHTPLTDKCYLVLTQGMHLGYGGNPFGPAGTGKTESVKALGNAMGRQVLVFNCDEGIDFKSMGRIFQGLVKCGAWGCFDEFNRLKPDQLSAVSTMIQAIQKSLKLGEESVHVMGKDCNLDLSAGIFVTLNPAGKHYGGRSQLPDNLKQLFRAVAMSIPDNELITETMLYSEGFANAKPVAKKMVEVFLLCKQLLSVQVHYDWGLRSLKSILTVGGGLIQSEKQAHFARVDEAKEKGEDPPKGRIGELNFECELVIKALRVNTLSKLTSIDRRKFNELIDAVFPGINIEEIDYGALTDKVKEVYAEERMMPIEAQIHKICQLYEASRTRMGVGIVGPSGSGKSTLIRILRKAMVKLGTHMPFFVMNPKAMPRHLLLGFMDNDTREWNDGVLTAASRKVVIEPADARSWILCDGDIDPEWIESLNSVLDDNRLLTMPNGERIQFGDNINFMFETHSLQYASPATVSRMNIIFLEEADVDINATIQSWIGRQDWLNTKGEKAVAEMKGWIDKYFAKALDKLERSGKVCVDTTRMGLVVSGLSHLVNVENKAMFALGLARGFGAYLDPEARVSYCLDVFGLCDEKAPDPKNPLNCKYQGGYKPYTFSVGLKMKKEDVLAQTMIETVSVQMNLDIMQPWIQSGAPFIVCGPEGAGKSMLLNNCFRELAKVEVATIFCNAQTSDQNVVDKLMQVCGMFASNQGKCLRPKSAERLILYLKDLNLPKPDMYATSMLHSLLQQLILYQGFYASDLEWIRVEKIQIVASMNPSGGVGRYPVASRFTALTSVVYVGYPSKEELGMIYQEFMHGFLTSVLKDNGKYGSGKGADAIAKAMVETYLKSKEKFLPDDRSHYIFTPRDVTGWICNLVNYDYGQCELPDVVAYEADRVFSDRLATDTERKMFDKIVDDSLKGPIAWKRPSDSPYFVSILSVTDKKTAKFGKKLLPIPAAEYEKFLQKAVIAFKREARDLNIVMVPEMLRWIARTDRILSKPGGHLLFAGRSGVGRKDICLLVAAMAKMPTFTLNMTPGYGLKQFKNDVRAVLTSAGGEGLDTVFFIEDQHVQDPQWLELVNSLLASNEIPGLFTNEEMDAIIAPAKDAMMEDGFMGTPAQYFLQRVAMKLHVVLIMDFTNNTYEVNCQSNPAIYTKCSVQWLEMLSPEAMKVMPPIFLPRIRDELVLAAGGELTDEKLMSDEEKKARDESAKIDSTITPDILWVHSTLGQDATPKQFTAVQHAYQKVYNLKFISLRDNRARLQGGLSKLADAEVQVAELSKGAEKQKKELGVKQKEADAALEEIQDSMEKAAVRKKEAENLRQSLQKEQAIIEKQSKEIGKELAGVEPLLQMARDAVAGVQTKDLNEIKSLANPPKAIADVLAAVLCLLGSTDFSWKNMKAFLGKPGVVNQIASLDASTITPQLRNKTNEQIKKGGESFKQEVIGRASKAAAPLASWCQAMVEYSSVIERVEPLTSELKKLEESAAKAQANLEKAESTVKELDAKVSEMKKRFQKMTAEAERLKANLEKAEGTLQAAEGLISKLSGEKTRWAATCDELTVQINQLPRLALLSGAYMTYLASDEEEYRIRMMKMWCDKFSTKDFEFRRFMRTEAEVLEWKSQGLPGDSLSADNAICILETISVPLVIDPAGQAGNWLKTTLGSGDRSVEVTSYAEERFMNTLELAIRFGKTLLIQEVDKVDPVLYPVLRKDFQVQGTKRVVPCGEKLIDYGETFRLYMVTRNPNIDLPPDARALVSATNFCITRAGLEGQLLGATIGYEKPELEEEKSRLLQTEEDYKMQLAKLEDMLLRELANSKGSLLENKTLIEALNEIKTKSTTIQKALVESKSVQENIDQQREGYRPYARQGSLAFFALQDLRSVNHMYQYSLGAFMTQFMGALDTHKESKKSVDAKVVDLIDQMHYNVYLYTLRSLFKVDRLMFGIHFAWNVAKQQITTEANEWKQFTGTGKPPDSSAKPGDWMDADQAPAFQQFYSNLPKLADEMKLTSTAWRDWAKQEAPESSWPSGLKLTDFHKLLVMQTLRPDRLAGLVDWFVLKILNITKVPPTNIGNIVDTASSSTEPMLFITTPGADPSQDLMDVAVQRVGKECYSELAMGGGQMEAATDLLKRGSSNGEWVTLKNLHLVVGWLPQLEKELSLLEPHEKFRLFLTSEATPSFPAIMLKNALKLTFESPPGVKKNLAATYDGWTPEFVKEHPNAQLLFSLAWLHAIVQERRGYCPQGFTEAYEFNPADLRASAEVLRAQCKLGKNNIPDWDTVYGILNFAIYGGRIDNEFDVRTLVTYLKEYFRPEILDGKAKLWKPLAMPKGDHKAFVQAVNTVPESNAPDMFVLSANADRLVAKTQMENMVASIRRLGGAAGSGGEVRFNRAVWSAALGKMFEAWQFLIEKDKEKLFGKPLELDPKAGPVLSFVESERNYSLYLVGSIGRQLGDLKKVLDGTMILSQQLAKLAAFLMKDETPPSWDKLWEGPEQVVRWLTLAVKKAVALETWVKKARDNSLLTSAVRLDELFRPNTFLNALKQETAAAGKASLDSLKLDCAWGAKAQLKGCAMPVRVEGLWIQCMKFDKDELVEIPAEAPGAESCPPCMVGWVVEMQSAQKLVPMPVYFNSLREKMLCKLQVPVKTDIVEACLRGTAVLVEL